MSRLTRCAAAIDFGTSNSAICLVGDGQNFLVPLEPGRATIPTAVFYDAEQGVITFGSLALAKYEDGVDGRLLRSLKSLLGSDLMSETTLINGRAVPYREIVAGYLRHLRQAAAPYCAVLPDQLVLGRPVHFVDDDEARDRLAQDTLADIARSVGFTDVRFQFEPIAAALDVEASLTTEELTLVVDIGGGTSDFTLIRLGPGRAARADRTDDILATTGVHVAGTDFDHRLSLATAMPAVGYGSAGTNGRPVPGGLYHDLSTWHRINLLYTRKEMAQAADLAHFMQDARLHRRLMLVLDERHGHRIASRVEGAKVAVADGGEALLDLDFIEAGLAIPLSGTTLTGAIAGELDRITHCAREAAALAGVSPEAVTVLYFTGGSSGVRELRQRLHAAFPRARVAAGDRFASVARGLGVTAAQVFGSFAQ